MIFQACIASAFHSLSQHQSLTFWLSEIGALPAVAHILNTSCAALDSSNSSLVTDALSALRLLVKSSDKVKTQGRSNDFIRIG